jgi:hypothetical protein
MIQIWGSFEAQTCVEIKREITFLTLPVFVVFAILA